MTVSVLGLDLSLTATGVCDGPRRAETIDTGRLVGDKRLCLIRDVIELYASRRPALAMVEAVPPYASSTGSLERVHGVAREVLARYDVPFAYVSPTSLKLFATGDGTAEKADMVSAVTKATGWTPADADQADAWWLRHMGQCLVESTAEDFAPHHLKAMSSVVWPLRTRDPDWPQPYGQIRARKPVVKRCGHKVQALRNDDHWLHPFTLDQCDKPPK